MLWAVKLMPRERYAKRSWTDWAEAVYCDKCKLFGVMQGEAHDIQHDCDAFEYEPSDGWHKTPGDLVRQLHVAADGSGETP